MASSFQIKKIHILKNILGIDDDTYLEMLKSFDVLTSKNLTFAEANIILENLEKQAASAGRWKKQPKKYAELNRDTKMATDAQLRMIESLWREVCYFDNDKFAKTSLRKFLKSKHRIDDLMFLTKHKASKVIQSILAMKKNLKKGTAAL